MSRNSSRTQILDAAERVFGRYGFVGASMRLIADEATVTQAALYYHFQDKEDLYDEVFKRHSSEIQTRRSVGLEALRANESFTLEDLLEVFFTPPFEDEPEENQNSYLQLVASVGISADLRSKSLMAKYYDPIASRFVAMMMTAVPGLTQERAVWSYLFAVGARMQAHARNDRAQRLIGDAKEGEGVSPYSMLVSFVAAGIRQQVADGAAGSEARKPRGEGRRRAT